MSTTTDFDGWADDFTAEWVRGNPQYATIKQYFEGAEQDALDRQLTLATFVGDVCGATIIRKRAVLAERGLAELRTFKTAQLTPRQRTSAAVIERRLGDAVAHADFAPYRFVFNQIIGLHVSLITFLTTQHPMRTVRDAENYLARLALLSGCLDDGIDEARSAAAAGIVPPAFILERTIEQLDGLLAAAPDHVLVTTFARRLADLIGVTADRSEAFVAAATTEVGDTVLPALGRVRALLVEQLPLSGADAGVWRLPRGADYYAQQLAMYTSSSLTASEIHAIGLREVARIEGEMDAILRELGYHDGSIEERVGRLNQTLTPAGDADPRDGIVEQLRAIVKDAEHRCEAVFDLRPKAPVTVMREPAFSEKSAAAHYTLPAPDGSKPGIYWVPLADIGPNVPWLGIGLKSTAYHEAVPGHHFQLAIEQELSELPRFLKRSAFGYDAAYAEGWALYSEQLSAENDWYAGDLPARLGYLHMQLFRARRLVVDTGLHDQKWTRQQAIDYGFPVSEIERYIVWPGQACSYMIGQLRIFEIRARARARLGERFSIKEFHNVVLSGATMPLAVLADHVDAWVASVLEATPG